MKRLLVALLLLLSIGGAYAIEVNPATAPTGGSTDAQIASINSQMRELQVRIGQTLTAEQFDERISKYEAQTKATQQNGALTTSALVVGVLILNDIILIGGYLIIRTLGWFA